MRDDGPSEANIKAAETVYPELSPEALDEQFGCFGGGVVRSIILFAALAGPAAVALKIIGDFGGWGRTILAMAVFCALSSLVFAGAA